MNMSYSFQTDLGSFEANGIIARWCLIVGLSLMLAAITGKLIIPKGTKRSVLLFTLYGLLMVDIGIGGTSGAERYLVRHQFVTMFGEPVPKNWDEHAKLESTVIARLLEEQQYFEQLRSNYLDRVAKLEKMPRGTTNDVVAYLDYKKYYVDWEYSLAYVRLDYCERLRTTVYAAGYKEEVLAIPFKNKLE